LTEDSSVPGGKIGENTWNSRLKEELHSRGFPSADFELHFPILRGRPRKPDVALANGGTHLISGKLGKSNEFEAFSSAQEYQQLVGATTNLGEVFGVVYPATRKEKFIIHVLANAVHERWVWTAPTLADAADIIRDVIEKRIESIKHPVEPPDASVVRLLQGGVDILHVSARQASERRLKEVFGGSDFFDSVLLSSVKEEGPDLRSVLSRAAAFLFINQLLFYAILKRETGAYPDIRQEDMSSPATIRENYFSLVLAKDYRPIFEIDVASLFEGERNRDGCLRVTRVITELARSVSTHDLAGKVFHEVIPLKFRKIVAAYYTNSAAADLLASLAISEPEITVLDPACGSGTLLVSAYRRKKDLTPPKSDDQGRHRRFVEQQITGLDAMAFSAHLAAVQLLLQQPLDYTEGLRIGTLDSTMATLGLPVKPFGTVLRDAFRQRKIDDFESGRHEIKPHEVVKSGAVAVGNAPSEGFNLDPVDLVIMNPPFTSSRRMAADYKESLKERFRSVPRYKNVITGNIGYHAYFLCLADRFLVDGGRMAVVMPFPTLVGGDFAGLTQFLVSEYAIEFIVCSQGRSAFSETTMFTEILFVARKGKATRDERTVLVLTKTTPEFWSADDVKRISNAAKACRSSRRPSETSLYSVRTFDQRELLPQGKTLTKLVAEFDLAYREVGTPFDAFVAHSSLLAPLGDLVQSGKLRMKVAEVVHGRSGDNPGHSIGRFGGDAVMVLRGGGQHLQKSDRLILDTVTPTSVLLKDRLTGDSFTVPKGSVLPALRRFAHIDQLDFTDREDLIIAEEYPGLERLFQSILGTKESVRALREFRKEWASVVESGRATVCFPGRIDLGAPGSKLIAIRSAAPFFMCSFMWSVTAATESDEKATVMWLNSAPFFYSMLSRLTVTRGSWVKFHSKQVAKAPFLDSSKLDPAARKRLAGIYDSLKDFHWPKLLDQYASPSSERKALDKAVLLALGVSENEADDLMISLYAAIASALAIMQRTMGADRPGRRR
jgi:hypothetical protein